jgi:hemolysin-activating ACP:hemolysin acyltransferase
MKASELVKNSVKIEDIYNSIEHQNKIGEFKIFYPHFVYVSDEVVKQLIEDGFKVSKGEWFKGDIGLIIEW